MCRWLAYIGSPIFLDEIIFEPENSLINQSRRATYSSVTTNGDGFGVGWYGTRDMPGVYHEVMPAEQNRISISDAYPKPSIPRRNTGYALDLLMDSDVFQNGKNQFNFCKLLAGSEGTLFFITEICLQLVDKPSSNKVLLCAHFNSIKDSLKANLYALKYKPSASELMDHYVLDCTKENIEHKKNRFFVLDDPRGYSGD